MHTLGVRVRRLKLANGRDVTKRAIIDVHSIVPGRNYDILTSIIAKLSRHGHSTTSASAHTISHLVTHPIFLPSCLLVRSKAVVLDNVSLHWNGCRPTSVIIANYMIVWVLHHVTHCTRTKETTSPII